MPFKLKKLNNESGMILFVVLMTVIVIMIFSVGILTQSMNEINYAQQQIDQITHDQEAKGAFWNAYASGMQGLSQGSSASTSLSGRGQTVTISAPTANGAVNNYTVTVSSDTFQ